jgi:TatD DNase family protein
VLLHDCHCHLHDERFDADRAAVIERARSFGVARALGVAEDLADGLRLLDVASLHADFLVPALGVHPDRAPLVDDAEVAAVCALARRHAARLGAIAEVGLDFRPCWDERARDRQREVLRAMVALARELGLPLSVHSRSAGRHAVDLLVAEGAERACLHAFDGRAVHALRGVEAGYCFSLPPSVVRSKVKQRLAERLPEESLLLESDSPVLGPDPAQRNEPANVRLALDEIARRRRVGAEDLAARIAANVAGAFPRLGGAPPAG